MGKKILITGASGFLGSHICEAAHEAGYEVHVMVRETSSREWLKHYWLNIHTVGLHECVDIAPVLRKMDVVIHAAGATNVLDPEVYYKINVEGTKNLALECIKAGVRRFVFISSHAAGGPTNGACPKTENDPDLPISSYGRSKKEAEEFLFSLREKMEVVSLRYPTVYGPRGRELQGVFQMLNGAFQPLLGYRSFFISMIYVADAAQAALAAATAKVESGSYYYITDGIEYTIKHLYDVISDALHHKGMRIRIPFWLLDFAAWFLVKVLKTESPFTPDKVKEMKARFWLASPQKAMKELGWKPKVLLKQGIQETVEWYRVRQWI